MLKNIMEMRQVEWMLARKKTFNGKEKGLYCNEEDLNLG